jgi:hypothetical protein
MIIEAVEDATYCGFCKTPAADECGLCNENLCPVHASTCNKCIKGGFKAQSFCHKHRVHSSHLAVIMEPVMEPEEKEEDHDEE